MTDAFRLAHDGPVTTLTLSNPARRNAMAAPFWEDFPLAVDELSASGRCRVLVITSEGPHFSSGIDLALLANTQPQDLGAAKHLDLYKLILRMQEAFNSLERARMPVIAAIQGGCIGGAVDLVTACDIRLVTDDAFFQVAEIDMGMMADVGTFPRILNHLPEGIVRELSYTGRRMGAEEAVRYGLANRQCGAQEACLAAAYEMAQTIAEKAPMAVYGSKAIITYARDHSTEECLDRVALWNASNLQASELMAAMTARQTKTTGEFAPLPPRRSIDGRDL
ncbi:MAG: enoyl-CoA hydratase-related protein [Parvularcula sp.]|jgi:enoyl-CoA hydratase|nr:enoyl-CoA hydratase-related protein [Parvularcula sp.]